MVKPSPLILSLHDHGVDRAFGLVPGRKYLLASTDTLDPIPRLIRFRRELGWREEHDSWGLDYGISLGKHFDGANKSINGRGVGLSLKPS